jgi:hypothetical protein
MPWSSPKGLIPYFEKRRICLDGGAEAGVLIFTAVILHRSYPDRSSEPLTDDSASLPLPVE